MKMNNTKKSKKYYWIKLTDHFLESEKVDYLVSQDSGNGFVYVVLYQCLCLKFINTNGRFETKVGEMIVKCDLAKLQRDLKWFTLAQIQSGFKFFSEIGLIYHDEDGVLKIYEFERLIGSETYGAVEKREQRKRLPQPIDKGIDNVYVDIRDKRLDIRDIDIRYKSIEIEESSNESSSKDITRYNEIKANGFAGTLFLKLVDCDYVSLYELDTDDYIDFFKELLNQQEVIDIKIKLEYFIHAVGHLLQVGTDKQDKPIYRWKYIEENQIGNKFLYLKTTITNAFNPKEYLSEEEQRELKEIIAAYKGESESGEDDDDSLPF